MTTNVLTAVYETEHSHTKVLLPSRTFFSCVTLTALSLFVLINIGSFFAAQFYGRHRNKSCENIISTFENIRQQPNIVLLGSSLMRLPFYLSDAQHSYKVPKYEEYCWNRTMQNMLNSSGEKNNVVFDLAIDGSMVSDVFLINRKLLVGAKAPKWIVYGIAPRDLLDNCLSKETRTPIFDRLFDIRDMWRGKNNFDMSFNDKLDLAIEKFCFLYSDRSTIQQSLNDACGRLSEARIFGKVPQRWSRGEYLDTLLLQKNSSNKNIRAYQKRYRAFQPEKFNKQKSFLKALCEEARAKGTNVLLVNMPLTNKITNLIPAEAYNAYRQALTEEAKIPGVVLLDLHDSKKFPNSSFGDLVHLNGEGGQVLNTLIADALLAQNGKMVNHRSNRKVPNDGSTDVDGVASWWLAKAYFAQSKPPDIVVLGSSQLWPILGVDADMYNKPVDITGDHRSRVLEYDTLALLNRNWRVFVGALPGAMISDQLVIARALFSKEYKPKLVAITFSPREFIDKRFPSIASTEAFAFFSKYNNPMSLRKSLYKARTERFKVKPNYDYDFEIASSLGLGVPFERIGPGENIICPGEHYSYTNNIEEYRQRYSNPLSPQFFRQMDCFNSLLEYLASQHIKVVAFNQPVSAANKNLLPSSFWKYYDEHISESCKKYGVDYISAERVVLPFEDDELIDGTHLNLDGGHRWSRVLAVYMANKFHWRTYQELLHVETLK